MKNQLNEDYVSEDEEEIDRFGDILYNNQFGETRMGYINDKKHNIQ
jgi:hypothetical protein